MLDVNDADPQRLPEREPERAQEQRPRYVPTVVAHQAVKGRGSEILDRLGLIWRSHRETHTRCPLGTHPDNNPSFRWVEKDSRYYCSCGSGSVFDVIMVVEKVDLEQAKIRAMELMGRPDLIVDPTARKEKRAESSQEQGLTLQEYAEAKQLPIEELQRIGVRAARCARSARRIGG